MGAYNCKCSYRAKDVEGILIVCNFNKQQSNPKKISDHVAEITMDDLEKKNGWSNNPYNIIGCNAHKSELIMKKFPKTNFILMLSNRTPIDRILISHEQLVGIIIDEPYYEHNNSTRVSCHHTMILAKNKGIPIVGVINGTEHFVPGQKIRILTDIPNGYIFTKKN